MPYIKFSKSQPSFRDERDEFVDNARNQEIALRDAFADGRLVTPFTLFVSGDLTMPLQMAYVDVEVLRALMAWGTTGGALDQPTQITLDWREDTRIFTPTDTIGVAALAYDVDGNLNTITWS